MVTYTVRIRLQDDAPIHLRHAAAVVRILDATVEDAPAEIIRERHFRDLRYDSADPYLLVTAFRLTRPRKRFWTVDVFVDVNGNGVLGPGDFVTMQVFPVGKASEIDVIARRVRSTA